jgi:pimeloyl-ACP methyl ester carboxylesterase
VEIKASTIRANGLEFGLLEAGGGPLALCLHGFPDTAHTWRYLLPELATAGFHAVAPFTRGYAPTAVPDDGRYDIGTLARDAGALHEVLGGDGHAVLIGHDWGAETAYAAAALAPDRWRRLVTLAVPPAALDQALFSDYEQLKRFFYAFLFRDTPGLAEEIVAADGMAFIKRLWQDWSPGFDAAESVQQVRESLRNPASLAAAIGYYRAPQAADPSGVVGPQAAGTQAVAPRAPQPTLYLHGSADGCIGVDLVRDAGRYLAPDSEMKVVQDTGHFLQLEQPGQVNEHIVAWVTS